MKPIMASGEAALDGMKIGTVASVQAGRRRSAPTEEAGPVRRRAVHPPVDRSAFVGFRFPHGVITVAVRWYLRYGLSYRDIEELLAERGVEVDHVTVYRWVQRLPPLFADAARPCRRAAGDRWFVDETYVEVACRWRYLHRAVDQFGQVIDVLLSEHRDTAAARRFFTCALRHGPAPVEVTTDKAGPYLRVLDELVPAAMHVTEQYGNNRIEADHGRLKARLRPMRGLKRRRSAARIAAGHAFVQNLRRGHYELATDRPATAAPRDGVHRTCPRRLNQAPTRPALARSRPTQQRPSESDAATRHVARPANGHSTAGRACRLRARPAHRCRPYGPDVRLRRPRCRSIAVGTAAGPGDTSEQARAVITRTRAPGGRGPRCHFSARREETEVVIEQAWTFGSATMWG
jgi:transposase-like protein